MPKSDKKMPICAAEATLEILSYHNRQVELPVNHIAIDSPTMFLAAASLAAAQGNDVDDTLDKYGDLLNNAIDRLARLDCNLLHEHAPILLNYPKWLKKRAHQVAFLITFVMLPDTERSVQRAIELAILRTEDAAGYIDLR